MSYGWLSCESNVSLYLDTLKSLEQTEYIVVMESVLVRTCTEKSDAIIQNYLVS